MLWDDTIRLGIELRKKMRAMRREFEDKETPRAPLVHRAIRARRVEYKGRDATVPWEDVPTDVLAREQRYWQLAPGRSLARLQPLWRRATPWRIRTS